MQKPGDMYIPATQSALEEAHAAVAPISAKFDGETSDEENMLRLFKKFMSMHSEQGAQDTPRVDVSETTACSNVQPTFGPPFGPPFEFSVAPPPADTLTHYYENVPTVVPDIGDPFAEWSLRPKINRERKSTAANKPKAGCLFLPCIGSSCNSVPMIQFGSKVIPYALMLFKDKYKNAIATTTCKECELPSQHVKWISSSNSGQCSMSNTTSIPFDERDIMKAAKEIVGEDVPIIGLGNQILYIERGDVLNMVWKQDRIASVDIPDPESSGGSAMLRPYLQGGFF